MSLTWETLNPGEYIKAGEFNGKPVTLRIASIDRQDFELEDGSGHEKRGVISFTETDRKWVLNKTNIQLLKALWPTIEDAIGQQVTLASQQVQFGREKVAGIRVIGAPHLTAPVNAQVKLPRRKPVTVTLRPTGGGAE